MPLCGLPSEDLTERAIFTVPLKLDLHLAKTRLRRVPSSRFGKALSLLNPLWGEGNAIQMGELLQFRGFFIMSFQVRFLLETVSISDLKDFLLVPSVDLYHIGP